MDVILIWLIPAVLITGGGIFWGAYDGADSERTIAASVCAGFMWPLALVCLPFFLIGWLGHVLGERRRARRSQEDRS